MSSPVADRWRRSTPIMGDDSKKPGAPEGGQPGQQPAASDGKWKGEEDGKFTGALEGGQSHSTPSHESKVGVGNRKVTDEDREAAKKPKTTTEVGVKPLFSKTLYDNSKDQGRSSKEGDNDQTFSSNLTAKLTGEALGATLDVAEKKAKLTAVNVKAEASVFHGQGDLAGFLGELLFGKKPEPKPLPSNPAPPAPMAARVTDMTTHGAPLAPGTGSPNVLIGGLPAWRVGPDMHLCPFPGAPPHGAGPTLVGAPTVLINGFPAARAGDFVAEPMGGPDMILLGCPTVMIGMAASPPPAFTPPDPRPEDLPMVLFESVASTDMAAGEASGRLEGEADLKNLKGKAEVVGSLEAAAMKAEVPLKLRVRVPYTTWYVGLGVTGKATLLAVGAEAGAGFTVNQGKKLFAGTIGASASIGPGGLGAKFSLDVSQK